MGYTTDFYGEVMIDPPLDAAEVAFLIKFADDDHSGEPMPGNYCQWIPDSEGRFLEWDGGEKFYNSVEWMRYLIDNFIRANHVVNGEIEAQGEERDDRWFLIVMDNVVSTENARMVRESELKEKS